MNLRILLFTLLCLGVSHTSFAQNEVSYLSGALEARANFFQRDSLIGAANTPGYDRQLFGAETWLTLKYNRWGYEVGARFDMFNNSNLLNPTGSYNAQGIGRWYVKKKFKKLGIYGGYIYDQIGSGIIFRAYEARSLNIDNALFGLQLSYDLGEDWQVRAFTGRQKQQLTDPYESVFRGGVIEGFLQVGDSTVVSLTPGFGAIARTLDDNSMSSLVATINTYTKDEAFVPNYNTYAFSFYNTLNVGKFTWYVEAAYKTEDAMKDLEGRIYEAEGTTFYSSLGFAAKGLGITLEGKRTEDFEFRTRPQEFLNFGLVNFLPPMFRINTYRLTARYNAATQFIGEQAFQVDVRYSPKRKVSYNVNFSNITDLDGGILYRELFTEFYYKYKRKWKFTGGVQIQQYNQEIFEFVPGVPIVEAITPYADFLYRLNKKKSIRFEAQYMHVGEGDDGQLHDYGHWAFALVELGIAPHWTFTISDMYNVSPGRATPGDANGNKESAHFPRFDVFYTHKANRFSLSYVKQVQGVVCTGGVCRVEPAFSGVRMTVNSTF